MIGIEEKSLNYVNSVFEVNIKTCHSRNEFRRCKETFGEYIDSAKKNAENKSGGVVGVNFDRPDIYQLFSDSQGIIHVVNAVMKPFLKCFGVEGGNGLSLFCRGFESKEELKHELGLFFQIEVRHPIKQQSLIVSIVNRKV